MLLAAVNKEQVAKALQITKANGVAVFATLDDQLLGNFAKRLSGTTGPENKVYFYETG